MPREFVDIETADPERRSYLDYAFERLSHAQVVALLDGYDDDLVKHLVRECGAAAGILSKSAPLPTRSMFYERDHYVFMAFKGLEYRQMAELLKEHDGELWEFICDTSAGVTNEDPDHRQDEGGIG